jgi:AGZA family xanthine/uracil permease-like MFS transporter
MTAVIPVVAISPILLYIGMLIGSQAFQESPHKHAPAIVVSLVPSIAAWGKLQIDNALGAVSNVHQVTSDMIASMKQVGVMYQGLAILGAGSILSGVVLGAITVFISDREFSRASAFATAGAVLTSFGLMHGEEVDPSRIQNPGVVVAYLVVAAVLYACNRLAAVSDAPVSSDGLAVVAHDEPEMATAK